MTTTELRELLHTSLSPVDDTRELNAAIDALLAVAEAASNDGLGHAECCRAHCGPEGEGWLEPDKCNCGFRELQSALARLREVKP